MKSSIWKRVIAVGCAISLTMAMTEFTVIADEAKEGSIIVVPDGETLDEEVLADEDESINEVDGALIGGQNNYESEPENEKRNKEESEAIDEVTLFDIEDYSFDTSEELVGAGDDYPSNLKSAAKDALVDPWNFYNRECTSFVA